MTAQITPRHIAIIMDGNGRWAQRRGKPRVFGHIRGASRIKPIVEEADRLGVKALTLYAFSTENWSRPSGELSVLWKLLSKYLRQEVPELRARNVRLSVVGELERLDPKLQREVRQAVDALSANTGRHLVFAISYGARRELADAARRLAQDCVDGKHSAGDINEQLMNHYLWTHELGSLSEVDLMIRTSGERRISNFLLWQAAYAELAFFEICWPDFGPEHLRQAVQDFGARDRRFGGVQPVAKSPTQEGNR